MIKLPINTQYSQLNKSDVLGDIWYTRNIDATEQGYLKLSSRAVSLFNEKDTGNVRLPLAFGRGSEFANSIDYAITQSGTRGYWLTLLPTSITLNVDSGTGVPTLTNDSHGVWFRNLWHVTDDTELYSKASIPDTATYTARSASLTSGKAHPLEVFRNRDTICVGNGNTVKQFDNSYSASTTLTLPTDYEVVKLAYSNYQMGVLTVLSDSAVNQNQEAVFFVWDGASTSATQGVTLGSDAGIAVVPYKGSWVVLTRTGVLKYFTGGGWQTLHSLPFFYKKLIWGLTSAFGVGFSSARNALGDVMSVEGDLIYFNFNGLLNSYGIKNQQYLPNNPGGILCYDPEVGMYHRYSPSISPASLLTVTSANINTSDNLFTKTAGTIPSTGSPIKYVSDVTNQIGGLTVSTIYYCIKVTSTTFRVATTRQNALDGQAVDITSTGASNNYFLGLEQYDFGQTLATRTGGVAFLGATSQIYDHMIFGAELIDFNSSSDYNHINLTVSNFENRGYAVTSKVVFENVEDNVGRMFLSYRPLKTGDSIIVKYKNKEINGLPVSTPQTTASTRNQCTWTSSTVFTTTANLADAYTAYQNNESLECEVIAGAGGGTLVQVSTIQYSAGTYTVTVAEEVLGAASGRYCDVVIDNWKQCVNGIITSDDRDTSNYKEIAIDRQSSWVQFKIELRGVDTAIRDIKITNSKAK